MSNYFQGAWFRAARHFFAPSVGFLAAWLGGLLFAISAGAQTAGHVGAFSTPVAAEEHGLSVGETVVGIISYARWPGEPAPIRLCFVGSSPYFAEIAAAVELAPAKRPIQVQRRAMDSLSIDDCEALYLGNVSESAWRTLASRALGHPVLTISEKGELCSMGCMFCLEVSPTGFARFDVNLDSIARSGVRVHPQVLRLARAPRKPI